LNGAPLKKIEVDSHQCNISFSGIHFDSILHQ